MTRLHYFLLSASMMLVACSDEGSMEQMKPTQKESIVRSLPTQDRQFLLQPLESALDDVREITDNNPGLETTVGSRKEGEKSLTFSITRDGQDTAKIEASISASHSQERHLYYFDRAGEIYLLESKLIRLDDQGNRAEARAYRIYYEENLVQLSAYGKAAFDGMKLPEHWVTICPTQEEEAYLLNWLDKLVAPR
ncbi:MAG: hypothetical protein RLP15_04280 [Cryomorphaceae bacterium]